jgi:epoxyqueuosine reductase
VIAKQHELKTTIKARAASLGFPLCGFTTAESPADYERFASWLSNGFHAGMAYLETAYHRSARQDPTILFPAAKTIIVLGIPYRLTTRQEMQQRNAGVICGYAIEKDYHERIPQMLEPLAALLQEISPTSTHPRIFTDSAPILERELAARAGLGWIGRNSCLINPDWGSAFLLAEIFTDVEIEPDIPFEQDHCGNCDRCIKACPTSCILPDRIIDANRCISYHSIENRAEIPTWIMDKFSNQVFGCDICQTVCPWNRLNLIETVSDKQENLIPLEEMDRLMNLSQQEFNDLYGSTPVSRVKRVGFIRNILIARHHLHSTGSNEWYKNLQESEAIESDPVLRTTARWILSPKNT